MDSSDARPSKTTDHSSLDSVLTLLVHAYVRAGVRGDLADRTQARSLLRRYFVQRHQQLHKQDGCFA